MQVNSEYFSEPSGINSFYAGFIAADGCIRDSNPKRTPSVNITISKEDVALLESFATAVGFKNDMTLSRDKYLSLTIPSQAMVDDLAENYKVTARKTLTLEPPVDLDYQNACAFIAGYVDGDGGYYVDERSNRPTMHIKGTYSLLKWMVDFTQITQSIPKAKGKNCHGLTLYGDTALHFRAHYIDMALPFLERKFQFWERSGANMTVTGRSKSINYETFKASE